MAAKRLKLFKKTNSIATLKAARDFKVVRTDGRIEREHETGMDTRPSYVWMGGIK